MASLVAYLGFNGNCKEAMNFYKTCLGGELTLTTIGESPTAARMPANEQNNVMHSMLSSGKITLMASDMVGGETMSAQGGAVFLCLICESKKEIETLFSKLSAGGKVTDSLKEQFFGTFGALTDKYGFNWMFQFSPSP